MTQSLVVNDVTGLNPVEVFAIATPSTVEEVQDAVRRTRGAVSVGGGHFSMGGQTASPDSLHLDLRQLDQVVSFAPAEKSVRVQAGVTWRALQRFADPHDLAVKIMQTYANFTVGGSLSVNCHGRYVGLGPLILSVRAISLVLASGERVEASPGENAELFYGAIGGYGALGVIVEAELELAANGRVIQDAVMMDVAEYPEHFRKTVRHAREAVLHNADLYPPAYRSVRSVTWRATEEPATEPHRLMPEKRSYPLHRYFIWSATETPLGKHRRQYLVDTMLYLRPRVHWRNYEAGYDVAELEPASRKHSTFVLQEYFVPVGRFDEFVPRLAEILKRHRVNALNVSIRHALPDPGSLLAWAREECFAFVLYYKQRVRTNARERVAVWTRELIDAALDCGGSYYLPYQVHATAEQFHRAYPRARELFALKRRVDPEYRFRNVLWDTYYAPTLQSEAVMSTPTPGTPACEFQQVYGDTRWRDRFYLFLQNVYRLYPEDRFHTLIREAAEHHGSDEAVYRELQAKLPGIKPLLGDLTYALPSLSKQKREMSRQTLELLGDVLRVDGYLEIGSPGRYVSDLRRHLTIDGDVVLVHETEPGFSPVDIVERGGLRRIGRWVPLDYRPIPESAVATASLDLVTCHIGLHHSPPELLAGFVASVARVLRPGGLFLVRDHDVTTPGMHAFVSLAHTVFNAGLGLDWSVNQAELRHFAPAARWSSVIEAAGFRDQGKRLKQQNDPTDNLFMSFVRT